jgi:hypothetical protein
MAVDSCLKLWSGEWSWEIAQWTDHDVEGIGRGPVWSDSNETTKILRTVCFLSISRMQVRIITTCGWLLEAGGGGGWIICKWGCAGEQKASFAVVQEGHRREGGVWPSLTRGFRTWRLTFLYEYLLWSDGRERGGWWVAARKSSKFVLPRVIRAASTQCI